MIREAYSVKEVAEQYGLHRSTIYEEINDGRLEAVKVRGRTVIFRDAVDAWRAALPKLKHG
jgi:excisionase family DNA binding protein